MDLRVSGICLVLVFLGLSAVDGQSRSSPNVNPYTRYLQQVLRRSGISPNSALSVKPVSAKVIMRPTYGQTRLQSSDGSSGSYRFVQPTSKGFTASKLAETLKPVLVALPNLGNLLYRYAKKRIEAKQQQPVYQNNIYRNMFGQNTYGPMPMPTSYQPQQPAASMLQMPQNTGYGGGRQTGYGGQQAAPAAPAPQAYQAQSSSGYGQQQAMMGQSKTMTIENPGWGGSIYITGPADQMSDLLQTMNQNKAAGGKPSFTSYNSNMVQQQMMYGSSSGGGSYGGQNTGTSQGYNAAPLCPRAPDKFCSYREAGHYTHPTTSQCFVQCDAFGRSFEKGCAPGTFWKNGGPEPAMFNKCS